MSSNRNLAFNLLAVVVGMLMLAYASVPLYRLFCQVTGYGGTTQEGSHAPGRVLDRTMTITFNTDTDPKLPWEFAPGQHEVKVKVGEQMLVYFKAKNLANHPVSGRAVYNVVPFSAGPYFVKLECFCFKQQTLPAYAEVNMPVSFYVDPSITDDPDMNDVKTITLSYTFFAVQK